MYRFDFHNAKSLDEAREIFERAEDATFIAGGMTLVPTLKQRLAMPSDVIDLSGVEEMKGIKLEGGILTIGALTTHAEVAATDFVHLNIPALASLAGEIGDPSVRNRGTIGGSIANSDPAADYPAAVLALGATIVTDRREIAADDYFVDLFETALEEGEVIKALKMPVPDMAGYSKFSNPASRYAIAGVFVAKFDDVVRVAVTGAGPCAFRQLDMEKALEQSFGPDALSGIKTNAENLNNDVHATPQYRAHLVDVMAARAVEIAGR